MASTGTLTAVRSATSGGGRLFVRPHGAAPSSRGLLRELAASGLSGRGGGGFPTARKLELLASRRGLAPILAVNAVESEPASSKDRALLELAPELVFEGARLAADLIGASEVVVCSKTALRAPYPVLPAPAGYTAGEESSVVAIVASRVPAPFFRADKAEPMRATGRPVLVQNAETLAQVALVARLGGDAFRTGETRLCTLSGDVARPGVYEARTDMTLEELVSLAGGDARRSGGVLLGGYGGTWAPRGALDAPLRPEALGPLGVSIGAGVVAVLPPGACGLAETASLARFLARESAGQCGPCVFGLPSIADDLDGLLAGRPGALGDLRRHLDAVGGRGGCGHPDGAVRLVASALSVFADDVANHLAGRPCGGHAGVLPTPSGHPARPVRPQLLAARRPAGGVMR